MTRIVVADDSVLIRQGLVGLLTELDGVEVVAECDALPDLESAVAEHQPDLVITDIRMPPTHTDEGIRAAIQIRSEHPSIGVLVISQFSDPEYVLLLFEQGSDGLGYLLKERIGDLDQLERAVRSVAAGGSSVDPEIIDILVSARSQRSGPLDRLTPREQEVLGCIAEGLNNASIAERLVLSEKAVQKHINSIFSKLDLSENDGRHKRVEAVLLWLSASG
ncbi:MAG: response regulator transcription factor [Actinomycetota bacterium]